MHVKIILHNNTMKIFFSVITFITLCIPAIAANYEPEEKINISVYEKINPAIVSIDGATEDGISAGTGCIVSRDGVILTG